VCVHSAGRTRACVFAYAVAPCCGERFGLESRLKCGRKHKQTNQRVVQRVDADPRLLRLRRPGAQRSVVAAPNNDFCARQLATCVFASACAYACACACACVCLTSVVHVCARTCVRECRRRQVRVCVRCNSLIVRCARADMHTHAPTHMCSHTHNARTHALALNHARAHRRCRHARTRTHARTPYTFSRAHARLAHAHAGAKSSATLCSAMSSRCASLPVAVAAIRIIAAIIARGAHRCQ
jgi:hypothetical protein